MAQYRLKLNNTTGKTAPVGQYFNSVTYSTSYYALRPTDWFFTDLNQYTITSVIFEVQFTGSNINSNGTTYRAPANIDIRLDSTTGTIIANPQYYLFDVWTTQYSVALAGDAAKNLTDNFDSYIYINLKGTYAANDIITATAPLEAYLVFEYTENFTPIAAPRWNINVDNYIQNNQLYVSNNADSPTQKHKLSLSWEIPTVINNDLLGFYIYMRYTRTGEEAKLIQLADGNLISEENYEVDFSIFDELKPGTLIYFIIQSVAKYGPISESSISNTFTIKNRPSPPLYIENTILKSIEDSKNFSYRLGSSPLGIPTSLLWKKDEDSELVSSPTIYAKDAGKTCKAYTFDGWDISEPIRFLISVNIKPQIDYTAVFSDSASGYLNDTITISDLIITNDANKTIDNIMYYIRASDTGDCTLSYPNRVQFITNSYKINPYDYLSPVFPGQYYQVGVQVFDGIEYSDIVWKGTHQIYGSISISQNNTPVISGTDNLTGKESSYPNYYRSKNIKISCTLPEIPIGLTKLYYQYTYASKPDSIIWTPIGGRISYTASDLKLLEYIYVPNPDDTLYIRLSFYNSDNERTDTQTIFSSESNALYYAENLQWPVNSNNNELSLQVATTDELDDRNDRIRPTFGNTHLESLAFSLTVPIPKTNYISNNTDIRYKILAYKDDSNIVFLNEQSIPEEVADTFQLSFNYGTLINTGLYSLCEAESDLWKGPYKVFFEIEYISPFGDIIRSLQASLIIDFREKPPQITTVYLGRDGIYNISNSSIIYDSNFDINKLFPILSENDVSNKNKVVFNYETMLITFEHSLSYPTQIIECYYIDLYLDGKLKKTVTYTPDKGQIHGSYIIYPLFVGNLFDKKTECSVKVRAKDLESYNSNISIASVTSNQLIGLPKEKPTININKLDIKFATGKLDEEEEEKPIIEFAIPSVSFNDNSDYSFYFSWPDTYTPYLGYNRDNKYNGENYVPFCEYSLEFSFKPDFSVIQKTIILKNLEKVEKYNVSDILEAQTGSFERGNNTELYIRGKVRYATGYIYQNDVIDTEEQIVYSTVKYYSTAQPTVAYRKNAVGINCEPKTSEILRIEPFGNSEKVIMMGLKEGAPIRQLVYDLSNGTIYGAWPENSTDEERPFTIDAGLFETLSWDAENDPKNFSYTNLISS